MLLENGVVGPAQRPVELRDHRRPVLHANLITTVFIAVEREHAAVGAFAKRHEHAVERIEHTLGREIRERRGREISVVARERKAVCGRAGCIGTVRVYPCIVTRIADGSISDARIQRNSFLKRANSLMHERVSRANEFAGIDQVFEEERFRV